MAQHNGAKDFGGLLRYDAWATALTTNMNSVVLGQGIHSVH